MASDDIDSIRQHVQEAMAYGQNVLDSLDPALDAAEDPDVIDNIEEATHQMVMSMDQGDQALEASEDEMSDLLVEMRRHAEQSLNFMVQVTGSAQIS
jgi:hypothetical protein